MNIQYYSVACITSNENKKNSSAVAREIGVSQSSTSRFLQAVDFDDATFLEIRNELFGKKKLTFVIDDTIVPRRYSPETEGVSSMVDPSTKGFSNAYRIVVGGVTDGTYFLPLHFEQWIAKFILQKDYLKITDIAKIVITKLLELDPAIDACVMDGLYFSTEFICSLREKSLRFTIKAKTTTCVFYKGEYVQLQHCKDLQLKSNQNAKTIKATWAGQEWWFTVLRREGKRGSKIIYVIAPFCAEPKVYAKMYNVRWTIETCFRTAKQSLGLKDSSSQYAHVYLNHTKCVFLAYALVQLFMKKHRLKSSEEAIRSIRDLKIKYDFSQIAERLSLLINYA